MQFGNSTCKMVLYMMLVIKQLRTMRACVSTAEETTDHICIPYLSGVDAHAHEVSAYHR